jgi:hypothetical protein
MTEFEDLSDFQPNQILANHITDNERGNDRRQLQRRLAEAYEKNSFNPNCSNWI